MYFQAHLFFPQIWGKKIKSLSGTLCPLPTTVSVLSFTKYLLNAYSGCGPDLSTRVIMLTKISIAPPPLEVTVKERELRIKSAIQILCVTILLAHLPLAFQFSAINLPPLKSADLVFKVVREIFIDKSSDDLSVIILPYFLMAQFTIPFSLKYTVPQISHLNSPTSSFALDLSVHWQTVPPASHWRLVFSGALSLALFPLHCMSSLNDFTVSIV